MSRKKFNAAERLCIEHAASVNNLVEWRNVTTWGYVARITSGIKVDVIDNRTKLDYVEAVNVSASTRTVLKGDTIRIYAGYIRDWEPTKNYR